MGSVEKLSIQNQAMVQLFYNERIQNMLGACVTINKESAVVVAHEKDQCPDDPSLILLAGRLFIFLSLSVAHP